MSAYHHEDCPKSKDHSKTCLCTAGKAPAQHLVIDLGSRMCVACELLLTSDDARTTNAISYRNNSGRCELLLPEFFTKKSAVDHPSHYGGKDNPYEAIKVIDAWRLGFALGNTVKYISRAGKKDPAKELEDLEKAAWYLSHRIEQLKAAK